MKRICICITESLRCIAEINYNIVNQLYLNKIIFLINSKYIMGLNLRDKITKLPEENMGENLYDLKLGKDFLNVTSKDEPQEKTMINLT